MSKIIKKNTVKRNPTVSELLNTIERMKKAHDFDIKMSDIEVDRDVDDNRYVVIHTYSDSGVSIKLSDMIEKEIIDNSEAYEYEVR